MIDRAEIRRRALLARDLDVEQTVAVKLTQAQADLALALDPATVLALLDGLDTADAFRQAVYNVVERMSYGAYDVDELVRELFALPWSGNRPREAPP